MAHLQPLLITQLSVAMLISWSMTQLLRSRIGLLGLLRLSMLLAALLGLMLSLLINLYLTEPALLPLITPILATIRVI